MKSDENKNENKNKLLDFIVKQWISNSSIIGDKILIVTNNTEAYKTTCNNCILIPELESNHKEADSKVMLHVKHPSRTYSSPVIHTPNTAVFKIALSIVMEFDCQIYIKTCTRSLTFGCLIQGGGLNIWGVGTFHNI